MTPCQHIHARTTPKPHSNHLFARARESYAIRRRVDARSRETRVLARRPRFCDRLLRVARRARERRASIRSNSANSTTPCAGGSSDGWCASTGGASVVSVVGRDGGEHGYVCRQSERSAAAAGAAVADALDVGGVDHGGAPGRERGQVPVSGGVFGRLHGEVAVVV